MSLKGDEIVINNLIEGTNQINSCSGVVSFSINAALLVSFYIQCSALIGYHHRCPERLRYSPCCHQGAFDILPGTSREA